MLRAKWWITNPFLTFCGQFELFEGIDEKAEQFACVDLTFCIKFTNFGFGILHSSSSNGNIPVFPFSRKSK